MIGKIKIIKENGYGFITPETGTGDIFFHASKLQEGMEFSDLKQGMLVSFDLGTTPRGQQAINLVIIEQEEFSIPAPSKRMKAVSA